LLFFFELDDFLLDADALTLPAGGANSASSIDEGSDMADNSSTSSSPPLKKI
jgi:hypothetical protein